MPETLEIVERTIAPNKVSSQERTTRVTDWTRTLSTEVRASYPGQVIVRIGGNITGSKEPNMLGGGWIALSPEQARAAAADLIALAAKAEAAPPPLTEAREPG